MDHFYIFLDIDGVLNKESDWKRKFSLDNHCLDALAMLYDASHHTYSSVFLILTSTWRTGVSKDGSNIQIEELEKTLKIRGMCLHGITPTSNKTRQQEIEYYIRRNNVTHYIILDDDPSLFPEPENINLYVTDYKTGLDQKDVKKILQTIKRRRR